MIEEYGWVIERGDSEVSAPTYWSGPTATFRNGWSQNHLDAIRFARKVDAEKISTKLQVPGDPINRVCEHIWG